MPDYVETNFDERSGVVQCQTVWGRWWQTVSEVHVEVEVPPGITAKLIKITIKPSHIRVVVVDKLIFEGRLYSVVRSDDTIWTLEDKKTVHIVMTKADACSKETAWEALLADNFLADPWTFHEMRKKLDLERFQIENPGFDFSGATLKKGYDSVPNSMIEKWAERKKELMEKEIEKAETEIEEETEEEESEGTAEENTQEKEDSKEMVEEKEVIREQETERQSSPVEEES